MIFFVKEKNEFCVKSREIKKLNDQKRKAQKVLRFPKAIILPSELEYVSILASSSFLKKKIKFLQIFYGKPFSFQIFF